MYFVDGLPAAGPGTLAMDPSRASG